MREYEDSGILYKCLGFSFVVVVVTSTISANIELGFVIGIASLLITLAHKEDGDE